MSAASHPGKPDMCDANGVDIDRPRTRQRRSLRAMLETLQTSLAVATAYAEQIGRRLAELEKQQEAPAVSPSPAPVSPIAEVVAAPAPVVSPTGQAVSPIAPIVPPAPPAPAAAPAWPKGDGKPMLARSDMRTFEFDGRWLTTQQLADLAGCNYGVMYQRLRHLPAAEAVAKGPSDRARNLKGNANKGVSKERAARTQRDHTLPPDAKQGARRLLVYRGEERTIDELARMAGVTYAAMHGRLKTFGNSAEAAMLSFVEKPPIAPPRSVFEHRAPAVPPTPQSAPRVVQPVEIPPGVKRTVAPTPPDRFDARSTALPMFSALGPGRYLDDEGRA